MEINEIKKFAEEMMIKLDSYYGKEEESKLILADSLKVGEELGELYNEILSLNKYQRKDKMNNFSNKKLEDEIADVVLTLFILSRRLNVNIEEALKRKISKVKKRDYKR